jgi:hypothetical protein
MQTEGFCGPPDLRDPTAACASSAVVSLVHGCDDEGDERENRGELYKLINLDWLEKGIAAHLIGGAAGRFAYLCLCLCLCLWLGVEGRGRGETAAGEEKSWRWKVDCAY